jgi:hypothetical protein
MDRGQRSERSRTMWRTGLKWPLLKSLQIFGDDRRESSRDRVPQLLADPTGGGTGIVIHGVATGGRGKANSEALTFGRGLRMTKPKSLKAAATITILTTALVATAPRAAYAAT